MAIRKQAPAQPTWWRRPVVHFVVLGALIFAIDWGLRPGEPSASDDETLLIERARALGLDRSDPIVRRRLAQVMRFVLEDRAVPPSDAEVREAYAANPDAFVAPSRSRVEHLYFGRGAAAREAAEALGGQWSSANPPSSAVAFVHGSWLGPVDDSGIDRVFGEGVGARLSEVEAGGSVVVESRFGWHVMRVESRLTADTGAEQTPRAEVRDEIAARLLTQRRAEAFEEGLAELRSGAREGWLQ